MKTFCHVFMIPDGTTRRILIQTLMWPAERTNLKMSRIHVSFEFAGEFGTV